MNTTTLSIMNYTASLHTAVVVAVLDMLTACTSKPVVLGVTGKTGTTGANSEESSVCGNSDGEGENETRRSSVVIQERFQPLPKVVRRCSIRRWPSIEHGNVSISPKGPPCTLSIHNQRREACLEAHFKAPYSLQWIAKPEGKTASKQRKSFMRQYWQYLGKQSILEIGRLLELLPSTLLIHGHSPEEHLFEEPQSILAAVRKSMGLKEQAILPFTTDSLWKNRAFALAAFRQDCSALKHDRSGLRSDKAFIHREFKKNPEVLQYISQDLLKDKEFMLEVIKDNLKILEKKHKALWYLPEEFWGDPAFLCDLIKNDIHHDGRAFVELERVRHNFRALEHAEPALLVNADFMAEMLELGYSPELIAPKLWATEDFVLRVIDEQGPYLMFHAHPSLRKKEGFMRQAVKISYRTLRHTFKPLQRKLAPIVAAEGSYPNIVLLMTCLDKSLLKERRFMFEMAKKDPKALCYHQELCDDLESMLAVLKKHGYKVLEYASDRLKDNEEFILAVLEKCDYRALISASDRLKDNEEFILAVLEKHGYKALEYASDRLKDNEEFILAVLEKHGYEALQHASKDLKDNEKFMLAVIKKYGYKALIHASGRLKYSKEFRQSLLAYVK